MNRSLLALALSLAMGLPAVQAADEAAINARVAEHRAVVKEFGGTLRQELQAAMKEGGPVNAIDICHKRAPEIAADLSGKTGWDVHRTSLKPRAKAPDAWESTVLAKFDEQRAAGKSPDEMEFYEVVENNGKSQLRYMKALGTAALCLNCHGSEVKPEVKAKIDALYPNDQAIGYQEGQIRGAVSISSPL